MQKLISKSERVLVAGARGMAGQAIVRALNKSGYGLKENGGIILTPSREELDLLDFKKVDNWFTKFRPTVVILAAAGEGAAHPPLRLLGEDLEMTDASAARRRQCR